MAKYQQPFEETQALYDEKIRASGLDAYINITILSSNKAKEIVTLVKPNELFNYVTKNDIYIIVNEKIFDQLPEPQRHIIVEESLAGIHYDTEKSKLILTQPDVKAYSGILSKFGYETWNVLRESVKTLYKVDKDEE